MTEDAGQTDGGGIDVTKLIGIAAAVGFVIGLLYDVGYFSALNLKLFSVLSYKDHLETLVFFVPSIAVLAVFVLALRNKPARAARWDKIVFVVAGVSLLAWLERDEIIGMPEVSAFILFAVNLCAFFVVVYCTGALAGTLLKPAFGEAEQRAIGSAVLGIIVFISLFGNVQGYQDASGAEFDARIVTAGGDGSKAVTENARLVRVIDGGLLVVLQSSPDQLTYLPSAAVQSTSVPLQP